MLKALQEAAQVKAALAASEEVHRFIEEVAALLVRTFQQGGKCFFAGMEAAQPMPSTWPPN